MNKRQKKKYLKRSLMSYLYRYVDPITDDYDWCNKEYDAIIDYCNMWRWKFTEEQLRWVDYRNGGYIDTIAYYHSKTKNYSVIKSKKRKY